MAPKKVDIGTQAPVFKIKDANGKEIDLAELTAKGPVLVRLTCGCSGCDKELAYFQEMHEAYKDAGLTSLAVFREPDAKVADYVKEKKLNMLYAVDTKGEAWNVFQTKTMPTNFLIEKGGKIVTIAAGCDPSGLLAKKVSAEGRQDGQRGSGRRPEESRRRHQGEEVDRRSSGIESSLGARPTTPVGRARSLKSRFAAGDRFRSRRKSFGRRV